MATTMDGSCSECFTPQQVEISPRYSTIECEFCGHSVSMFEKREIAAIRNALATERRKMYIAIMLLAGAVFFFGLYVWVNTGDPEVAIPSAEGEEITGVLVGRDDTSVTIRTPTGERKYTFATIYADKVGELRQRKPFLSEETAAAQIGSEQIIPEMPTTRAPILFVLALLASLAAVAFSFIAGQDMVVAEF